jgi:hypothetical protein
MRNEFLESLASAAMVLVTGSTDRYKESLKSLIGGALGIEPRPAQRFTVLYHWFESKDDGHPKLPLTFADDEGNVGMVTISYDYEYSMTESCFLFYRSRSINAKVSYTIESYCMNIANYNQHKATVNARLAQDKAIKEGKIVSDEEAAKLQADRAAKDAKAKADFDTEIARVNGAFEKLQMAEIYKARKLQNDEYDKYEDQDFDDADLPSDDG